MLAIRRVLPSPVILASLLPPTLLLEVVVVGEGEMGEMGDGGVLGDDDIEEEYKQLQLVHTQ